MKKILIVLALLFVVNVAEAKIVARSIADDYCSSVVTAIADPTTGRGNSVYLNLIDGTQTIGTETGEDVFINPVTMRASHLKIVAAGSTNVSGSYTVTLRDDAADTALTCTVSGTATTCNDDSHIVEIAEGSKLDINFATDGTADAQEITEGLVSFCLTE